MDKSRIIEALEYHEVPETDREDIEIIVRALENCFYPTMCDGKTWPKIEMKYCLDLYDEWYRWEFNIVNKVMDRWTKMTIENVCDMQRSDHEELADKLLDLDAFARSIRVLSVDDLQRWENMIDKVDDMIELEYLENDDAQNTLKKLSQEIMSVRM